MKKVIGVRFRENGKIYFFNPMDTEMHVGDNVIVETVRGVEFATVVLSNRYIDDEKILASLKPIQRKATDDDVRRFYENKEQSKKAFDICAEKIANHGLQMKLVEAEYTFDRSKVLFYFTADGRIDFRELVKDLAGQFRTRIELRQIGVRDETKLQGGIGICGRELCCHSYLSDFIPVSIKMAKEQNLSLNPTKISGVCGRLMCCLKNEQDTYEYLNSRLPNVGDTVTAVDGVTGEVASVNVLRQRVKLLVDDSEGNRELVEYPAEQLKTRPKRRRDNGKRKNQNAAEEKELSELEALERREGKSKLD